MHERIANIGWLILAGILFGTMSATGVLLVKDVEHRFAQVVSNASITRIEKDGDGVLIWGTFYKERDCKFIEATANVGAVSLDLEFKDEHKHRSSTRPTGPQVFGPWRLSPSIYPIRVTVRHSCHSLWVTSTTMIESYKP